MRIRFGLTLTLILTTALLSFSACKSVDVKNAQTGGRAGNAPPVAPPPQPPPNDGVRRVTIPELQEALAKGEAVVVDVRGHVEYQLGHIKGSVSVPLGLIAEQLKDLPRDKLIVTYCACTHEQLSIRGVQEMKKLGIENAAALVGGWDAWVAAGLPTEKTE